MKLLSHVRLFVTPWTAAHQTSLSFTISWILLKFMSTELVMPSNHLILWPSSPALNFPRSGSYPISWFFASGPQSIGAAASALVLPMNIQGWFPLGLIGLISLLSKRLSTVFASTIVQKHQFFSAQSSLWSNSHIYWKNNNFNYMELWDSIHNFVRFRARIGMLRSGMSSFEWMNLRTLTPKFP